MLWRIKLSKVATTPFGSYISARMTRLQLARDEGFVCIGWTNMGDLSKYTTREATKKAMESTWPNWKLAKVRASYGQVFRFAHEMKKGDPIVFPIRGTREIALGTIASGYQFSNDPQLVKADL